MDVKIDSLQIRLKEYGKKDFNKESDYCIYHHRPGVPAGGRHHLVCVEIRKASPPAPLFKGKDKGLMEEIVGDGKVIS